jgi:hypothetical protein
MPPEAPAMALPVCMFTIPELMPAPPWPLKALMFPPVDEVLLPAVREISPESDERVAES